MTGLLPTLAKDIGTWFVELDGRSIAVSEARITKENMPTLPLVMVAFAREVPATAPADLTRAQNSMVDSFVVEFWMTPSIYTNNQGAVTPFWGYYDYEAIRDRLLSNLRGYVGPAGERIKYVSLTQESDALAVVLTFTFVAMYEWCSDDAQRADCQDGDGQAISDRTFKARICEPKVVSCPPCPEPETEKCP